MSNSESILLLEDGSTFRGQSIGIEGFSVGEVVFNTSDFSGKVTKIVTVITNEKVLPDRSLTLSAFVKSEFDVKPPLLSFGEPHTGDSPTRTVRVIPLNKNPIKIGQHAQIKFIPKGQPALYFAPSKSTIRLNQKDST